MSTVIGIDLGTTNSVVSILLGGKPEVIVNSEGERTTPSIVAYTRRGDLLVGQTAKRQAVINPENTFYSVKRFIGRKTSEVTDELLTLSYKILKNHDNIKLECPALNKQLVAEEISAQILRKLTKDASKYTGQDVKQAVITVPAYFNDSQRQATQDAGRIAGLEVLRIINEPTAAALAYGLNKKTEETILVFDLGGGTFDVSILEHSEGVFEVLATSGDSQLGGDDFNEVIVQWLLQEFKKDPEHSSAIKELDPFASTDAFLPSYSQEFQRVSEAAEKAKIELSSLSQSVISLPFLVNVGERSYHLETELTREKFDELCSNLIQRCRIPIEKAIIDAKLNPKEIDENVLVGGSTRIPAVQELIKTLLGKEPNLSVNPDEVVSLGAAVQGGILAGEITDILLLDVTPLSLGIETLGGITTTICPRNTMIPVTKFQTFSTATDNQPKVDINILQGERKFARDNKSLGIFTLDGITPAPKGMPQIKVTFDIDANGILSVTAIDQETNVEKSVTISGASTLPKDEVDRMVKEAEKKAIDDKKAVADTKQSKFREIKNKAETIKDSIRKKLRNKRSIISTEQRKKIEYVILELNNNLLAEDFFEAKQWIQQLTIIEQRIIPL